MPYFQEDINLPCTIHFAWQPASPSTREYEGTDEILQILRVELHTDEGDYITLPINDELQVIISEKLHTIRARTRAGEEPTS